jgi:hypothetical protein
MTKADDDFMMNYRMDALPNSNPLPPNRTMVATTEFLELMLSDDNMNKLTTLVGMKCIILYIQNYREKVVCCVKDGRCGLSCFRCINFRRIMCKTYHTETYTDMLSRSEAACELKRRLIYEVLFGMIRMSDLEDGSWMEDRWHEGHGKRLHILWRKASLRFL